MNSKQSILAFAAFCTAAFSSFAVTPGEVANVTLALSASMTNETTNTNTSYVSSIKVFKYTNAQLLQDLLDEGNLGDATSIKGWKLVVVNSTPLLSDNNPTLQFFAVNGSSIVPIDPARFNFDAGGGASAEATKATLDGDPDNAQVVSFTSKFTSLVAVTGTQPATGDQSESDISLHGIASGSQKSSTVTVKDVNGGSSQTDTYNLIGAVKVGSISGAVTPTSDSDSTSVISGSMAFSAFVATDISNYLQ